jgi:hypothetical protein
LSRFSLIDLNQSKALGIAVSLKISIRGELRKDDK